MLNNLNFNYCPLCGWHYVASDVRNSSSEQLTFLNREIEPLTLKNHLEMMFEGFLMSDFLESISAHDRAEHFHSFLVLNRIIESIQESRHINPEANRLKGRLS